MRRNLFDSDKEEKKKDETVQKELALDKTTQEEPSLNENTQIEKNKITNNTEEKPITLDEIDEEEQVTLDKFDEEEQVTLNQPEEESKSKKEVKHKKESKSKKEAKSKKESKSKKEIKPKEETKSKEENESKEIKYITIEVGTQDINKIKKYLEKDLNPTSKDWEQKKDEYTSRLKTFILAKEITPNDNMILLHELTGFYIDIQLEVIDVKKKIKFLKNLIEKVSKQCSTGSNTDERKLNAYLGTLCYRENPDDEPVDLNIYLKALENMYDFYDGLMKSLNKVENTLVSDRYLYQHVMVKNK